MYVLLKRKTYGFKTEDQGSNRICIYIHMFVGFFHSSINGLLRSWSRIGQISQSSGVFAFFKPSVLLAGSTCGGVG